MAHGQATVNLTAGPSSATLPGGTSVPMWGYTCGTASGATCSAANPNAGTGWSPVIITMTAGQDLTINLANNLTFTPVGGTTPNTVPTSLVIVGQLGGGLGTTATSTPSPDHTNAQGATTWPIAGGPGATAPVQGSRVQSFSTEVAVGTPGTLTWTAPKPGTYLLESGTHPSIQAAMGLVGMLVVTTPPATGVAGTAYPAVGANPAVTYDAEVPLIFSEIDPVQNNAVSTAVNTIGFSETMVWSGQPTGCGFKGSTTYNQCYPPVVNYKPLYYLINGVAFDKTAASHSLFPTAPATGVIQGTGKVLVRLVNAGLRMHIPSIVGSVTGSPAVGGFSLIAEDGNPLPGLPRAQSEVFMAAGKTYDVMVNAPVAASVTAAPKSLPIFDRQLSLSGNATGRDSGMLAYISVDGGTVPADPGLGAAVARTDTYNSLISGKNFGVSDPSKGVIANDTNVYAVSLLTGATNGTVTLNPDGTFTYLATGTATTDSFTYCANGSVTAGVCSSGITATVNLGAATVEGATGITLGSPVFNARVATYIKINAPGLLTGAVDAAGYPLKVVTTSTVTSMTNTTLFVPDSAGGFTAVVPAGTTSSTISFTVQNSQGTTQTGTATVNFPTASGLKVTVLDGKDLKTPISDYRWIIEEDRTFYVDPTQTVNTGGTSIVPTFGTNFHTSYMPIVATGCTGPLSCEGGQTIAGQTVVCDQGNGVCRADSTGNGEAAVDPSQVHLDPTRRYYISILPGDAANAFEAGNLTAACKLVKGVSTCGHGMGGAPIGIDPVTHVQQSAVTVYTQPNPYPPSKLSVFVFQDDFPLNGEQDGGGGIDVLSPNEPGLGQFNITIFDDAGGSGDATGQVDYDMFNMPLSNSLAGTKDPATGFDACPISAQASSDPLQKGITGQIVTCPKYESDGATLSPLAGQAVVANMMPGRYGIVATPGADRIARGEEWLQTNTLDGQKAHDSFLRIGEPSFFQEYGPAGYHVSIGFANPKIINSRLAGVCNGSDVNITGPNCDGTHGPGNTVTGFVSTERMSRTPDERLYGSGTNDSFSFTQCYVSFGDPDGEDFAFTKCDSTGHFTLTGLPDGDWRVTIFDQWNDMLVDGLSTPVRLSQGASGGTTDLKEIAVNQWQANIYTTTFFDANGNGVRDANEEGLTLVPTNVRFRDGSFSNFNNTDLDGNAGFNEEFPLFSWYVVETDATRYKNTGTHVVYDAGGPADGTCTSTTAPCGSSTIGQNMANTAELASMPANLRVPGAVYCDNADCNGFSIATGPVTGGSSGPTTGLSTGRIDPPWVLTEGWQGYSGQNSFLEFGKKPYNAGENGGIRGHVIYASTRPFDDPTLLLQTSWEPLVPNVTINLYQEGTAPDGSVSLKLVDTTTTSSFDDWAQGFRSDGIPNMNCPGQITSDLFYFSLYNQPDYLDVYNNQHNGTPLHTIPNNSQFKCYDGMHNWNQLQPAPYDGMYQFPSVTGLNPVTGKPAGTNCTICIANPSSSNPTDPTYDPYRAGLPMLPAGKYVVEVVVPPGYELVKEEDKNILIGDNFIAPVTVQFPGLGGSIFILPDQASVASAYNSNNAQNPTSDLGRTSFPSTEADTGSTEVYWPCVGTARVVPDYISLFPGSAEVSPFAGATRNLCDRKEVTLNDQSGALAKFYIFTSAHAAAHFTGVITDDYTSEFDPFSPQFGEKFAPPDLPISIKDWTGLEIARVYSDHWGAYNGLTYSTWEVNPPNPTGYSPTMMVTCMNDPGNGPTPDPLFNPQYSQFCYEIPFMPGQTQYMDTPVVPTSAFAGAGYNNPDCAYPDATPAIASVTSSDIAGPWVSTAGHTLTITALGDQLVPNNAYSGPSATTAPYNQKKITRHYGFGATQGSGIVTIGGLNAPVVSWSDTQIVATVPSFVPNCNIQQQIQYSKLTATATAQCGELVITAGNGKQSVDTVTVTIGGKTPTVMPAGTTIQSAIDTAAPGDMIIVPPGTYYEMVQMWKPVRLQGVGAASSIINANTHPAGKMDTWRQRITCLFGLALNGTPASTTNPYDPSGALTCPGNGWTNFTPTANNPQVDRLPLEATVGWDATLNGNLAELLQEPTLMGALEGAAITVLSKGVNFPSNPFAADTFPTGTLLLTSGTSTTTGCGPNTATAKNPFPSNFWCNPSSIDGLGITDSSQGGGGVFVHAWGHNLQIANNRVYNNAGTLSGGINVGQGEFPPAYLGGTANAATNAAPGSCQPNNVNGLIEPYCHDMNVNVHHNAIMLNSSTGDELFSATPAGAGGISFCTGSDYYKFQYNWVCGNLSTGDGGGLGHIGFSYNGDIEHNTFLFNQSTNPTIPTNGGGLIVMGAPDADPPCGATTDADCVPPLGSVGPSDGSGPGLVINANLILGNAADSGSGGGLRLQNVNGSDVVSFPTTPSRWNTVSITNNIIADNVAGWDGAGISLLDALNTNIVNNTVVSNDTTASAGTLFNTLGAPLASASGPTCTTNCGTTSAPQPAGVVSIQNSAVLTANLPASVTCPANHGGGGTGTGGLTNGTCILYSVPELYNNVFWQNRAFYIGVGALGGGTLNQQNIVSLYDAFTSNLAPSQPQSDATSPNGTGTLITGGTGACVPGTSYWDIGVRGDTGPSNHSGGLLSPSYSIITDITDYSTAALHNTGANPTFVSQYCNGSRVPPELGSAGYQVPPGISDATVPNPVFNLTPAATVDEGNNWVNMSWGPLAMTTPSGGLLGDYALASSSGAINLIPSTAGANYTAAPGTDFFGNPRKTASNPAVDAGAVEFAGTVAIPTLTAISPNSGERGHAVAVTITGTNLNPVTSVTVSGGGVTVSGVTAATNGNSISATFTISATASTLPPPRNVTVTTPGGTVTLNTAFTIVAPSLTSISPNSGVRGTTVAVTLTGVDFTGATSLAGLGANITVSGFTVVNDTSITANLVIAAGAALGNRPVAVVTPNGTTNTVPFTVTGPVVPALTSISPNSGVRGGGAVPVTITGTNLSGVTSVNIVGTNITVGSFTVNAAGTQITTSINPAINAALGTHNVTVTAPTGNSNPVTFRVTGGTVAFSAPSPALNTGGTGTKTGTVTVSNTATGANAGPITLTAAPAIAKTSGTGNGTFSITGGTCVSGFVINAGSSCTITVQYASETNTSTANGRITLTDTGAATATQNSAVFPAN